VTMTSLKHVLDALNEYYSAIVSCNARLKINRNAPGLVNLPIMQSPLLLLFIVNYSTLCLTVIYAFHLAEVSKTANGIVHAKPGENNIETLPISFQDFM